MAFNFETMGTSGNQVQAIPATAAKTTGGFNFGNMGGSPSSAAIADSQRELSGSDEVKSHPIWDFIKGTSVGKFGTTLGTAAGAGGETKAVGEANIAESESQRKLAKLLQRPDLSETQKAHIRSQLGQGTQIATAEEQTPELTKTAGQVAGEAAGTLATTLVGASQPATVIGRLGMGTAIGALSSGGKAMEEKKKAGEVAKEAAKGAGVGLAVSGAIEGLTAAIRGIASSSAVQKAAGRVYNHELQPPTKEVASQIESGFKTFGEKARDIVDDTGKPVYVGTYNTLLNKAKGEIANKGSKLMTEASNLDNTVAPTMIDDIGTRVLNEMEETFGMLDDGQVAKIINETKRVPSEMNVTQMIEAKRKFDSLIPDSYWLHAGDANTNFISQVRYAYRDALRRSIDESADAAGNEVVKSLNNDISVAMDMKKLAASQMAMRQTQKLPWFKAFQRLVDDTILNPAITTRFAQGAKSAATVSAAGGQNVIRGGAIRAISSELEGEKSSEQND